MIVNAMRFQMVDKGADPSPAEMHTEYLMPHNHGDTIGGMGLSGLSGLVSPVCVSCEQVLLCLLKGTHGSFFRRTGFLGAGLCGFELTLRFAQGMRIALAGLPGAYRLVQGALGL